jgi:hypothetical protein
VEPIRRMIEGFLRGRYSLAELIKELGQRAFRGLAGPVLIGVILLAGYLLLGPLLTIPRFTTEGPVVRNGVAVVVACGKKQGIWGLGAAMRYPDEPATGGWWPQKQGDCTVWYHRPPLPDQRFNRHERARREQTSAHDQNDSMWACGRKVLPGHRGIPREARKDFAKGMRKDCGIFGPRADGASGGGMTTPIHPSAWKGNSANFA